MNLKQDRRDLKIVDRNVNENRIGRIVKGIFLVAIGALLVYAFVLSRTEPKETETVTETQSVESAADEAEAATDPAAGDLITQDYGKSDAFFKTDGVVLFDSGKGSVDITRFIKGWAFGVPLVSVKDVPSFTDLSFYQGVPAGASVHGVEIFAEGEFPKESEDMIRFFYLAPNKDFAIYQSGSGLVNGRNSYEQYMYKLEKTPEGDILISIDEIPYYDGETFCIRNRMTPLYEDKKTVFVLTPDKG